MKTIPISPFLLTYLLHNFEVKKLTVLTLGYWEIIILHMRKPLVSVKVIKEIHTYG